MHLSCLVSLHLFMFRCVIGRLGFGLQQTWVKFGLYYLFALPLQLALLGVCIMKLLICEMGMKGLEAMSVQHWAQAQALARGISHGGSSQHYAMLGYMRLKLTAGSSLGNKLPSTILFPWENTFCVANNWLTTVCWVRTQLRYQILECRRG